MIFIIDPLHRSRSSLRHTIFSFAYALLLPCFCRSKVFRSPDDNRFSFASLRRLRSIEVELSISYARDPGQSQFKDLRYTGDERRFWFRPYPSHSSPAPNSLEDWARPDDSGPQRRADRRAHRIFAATPGLCPEPLKQALGSLYAGHDSALQCVAHLGRMRVVRHDDPSPLGTITGPIKCGGGHFHDPAVAMPGVRSSFFD